ncbi:MAG: HAD family hydrolase [Pseudomonadota bacterium]
MRYEAYLFDLDGTLYDRDALLVELAADQYICFKEQLPPMTEAEFCRRLIELDAHGYVVKPQVYAQLAKEWGLRTQLRDQLIEHFYAHYNNFIELPEDTLLTLEQLLDRNKKLGLVTNGQTAVQRRKIDALGLDKYFEAIVISESIGIKKPNQQIFEHTLKQLTILPDLAVFVGDHPENDIAGALNAGLDAIWRRVPYWHLSHAHGHVPSVNQLSEILDL